MTFSLLNDLTHAVSLAVEITVRSIETVMGRMFESHVPILCVRISTLRERIDWEIFNNTSHRPNKILTWQRFWSHRYNIRVAYAHLLIIQRLGRPRPGDPLERACWGLVSSVECRELLFLRRWGGEAVT